jgi:DDE family transposase
MIISNALPGFKRFLCRAALSPIAVDMLIRFAAAFIHHDGRMSASQAAGAIRSAARHRAAIIRFLADTHWSENWAVLSAVADLILRLETCRGGTWVFILDQTYCGHQGTHSENTFSRGNYRQRPKKGNRKNKKHARHCCHCFVMGLLLTPSGFRIPCCRCYYTKDYCKAKNKTYRTQTRLAAELVGELAVPETAKVVVLGDTSFDAKDIRVVCRSRDFHWIVPSNPERVLAGPKPRPQVKSLIRDFSSDQFVPVRLLPAKEPFAAQRRVARCRLGPKVKGRTYYVHQERRAVHSVGEVQLVFSTTEKPESGKPVKVQKVLMSDDLSLSATRVVQLYALRWQIELFFKELKSTLGLAQYRFQEFVKVEGWVQACLVTFAYLEWYRGRQLRRSKLTEKEQRWWQCQRSHGLCQALRQEVENNDLKQLLDWSQTRSGLKKLKKCLREARALEYRKPLKNQNKLAA